MTDSEYLAYAEHALSAIETAVEVSGAAIDVERSGSVLTLEFDDGSKIIVNLQAPRQEIWVAAQAGGFHFCYREGAWRDTRSEGELFELLSRYASQQAGVSVVLASS